MAILEMCIRDRLSVPKEEADAVMEDFEKKHMDTKVSIIGQVLEEETNGKNIRLV